jgi:hypothetical protein
MKEFNDILITFDCRAERRNHFRDLRKDEKIILKLTLQEFGLFMWTQFIWLRMRPSNWVLWNVQDS